MVGPTPSVLPSSWRHHRACQGDGWRGSGYVCPELHSRPTPTFPKYRGALRGPGGSTEAGASRAKGEAAARPTTSRMAAAVTARSPDISGLKEAKTAFLTASYSAIEELGGDDGGYALVGLVLEDEIDALLDEEVG